MNILYHTKIKYTPVAKNGSEKLGVTAECLFWVGDSTFRMELSQFGKNKADAEDKILKVLFSDDIDYVECVDDEDGE